VLYKILPLLCTYIDFIWNIEYSWREEGGDCTDDSRSIARHFCCDIDDSSLSEQ